LSVAAVVLAAGASTRLGQPKQSVRLGAERDSETLLERTVRIAHSADLEPVFVVLSSNHSIMLDTRARILVNQAAAEGMASSIRTGVAAAVPAELEGIIILACDQPAVTEEHLRALAGSGDETVASAYAGRKGVPAYFPRSAFPGLMELHGDIGAREMLRDARAIPLNNGDLDIDTAEDLKRARQLYASVPPLEAERG
jgi:molybdenum cofactor cytidylyltransferase